MAYCDGESFKDPVTFEGYVTGNIVRPRGKIDNTNWDSIFQPQELDYTFAEMGKEFKSNCSHRSGATA